MKSSCDTCNFYVYDEEYECYTCEVNLDEDEYYRFVTNGRWSCPHSRSDDEYKIVRHQI